MCQNHSFINKRWIHRFNLNEKKSWSMKFNVMMRTKFKNLNDCLINVSSSSMNEFLKLNITLMIKYYNSKFIE